MTLPVSSYEELLVQVRELTHETILLQKQLSSDLFDNTDPPDVNHNFSFGQKNYVRGKHLADNVIRQYEKSRKIEAGHSTFAEYNNFRFRPQFCQNLEPTESIRAGELTSRLLAWRSRGHHPVILQEDTDACQKRTESGRVLRAAPSGVGVEGLSSWPVQRRPHGTELPTPLGNVAAHELVSSAGTATFNPVVAAATSARCNAVKSNVVLKAASSTSSSASSSSSSSSASSTSVNVNDLRPRLYLGSVIAETNKEDAMEPEVKEEDERRSSTPSPEIYVRRSRRYNEGGSSEEDSKPDTSLQSHRLPSSYRGTWPIRRDLWANQQMGFPSQQSTSTAMHNDVASVMSFSSNSGATLGCSAEMQGDRRLGAKVDVVYNLLGMLGSTEGREDMSATLLSMSNSIDSCLVMRQSGCLPLLVQLIHAPGQDPETRERASKALHNVVHAKSDERAGRREARVLRFLEQLRDYCQALRVSLETGQIPDDLERHPGQTIAALMKLSFDEAHRHAMCQLGGLHAVAELIEMDHMAHGSECDDQNCITLRRYAGMALTNLTFGDGNNKALLCSFREFMKALVSQLRSPSDDLRQVTASVLRNLSWRADTSSKQTLREVGAVTGLMKAAMEGRKESTLKSILSALWNLSAHCSTNKVDICAVDGALAFLVDMLSYKAPSKTLAIVENAGGILRNVSSHIAVREDYRAIVRERGCLQVLLQQLRSPSLTVVSNACGALWNLSARCPQDQRLLWDLGAVPMLRSLVHSKHKMISMGSSAALKNLLSARPGCNNLVHLDSTARGLGLPTLPTLVARRQRALEQEIDQNLAETCDNIEPSTSPTNKDDKFSFKVDHSFLGINARALRSYQLHNQPGTSNVKCNGVARSESRDSMRSITSTHSDTMFERVNRHVLNGMSPTDIQIKQQSSSLHSAVGFDAGATSESHTKTTSEKKYTLRYKNAIPDRLKPSDAFNDISDLRCTNSTISWSSAPDQESACSQTLLHSSVEDNLSLVNQSMSSTSKTGSQSSISEEVELTVCTKSEYQRLGTKPAIDTPASLSFAGDSSSSKDTAKYGKIYTEKTVLHQHSPLNNIPKGLSPTVSHNSDGNLFSDYAETDLDQPTDYSLRYAEHTTEDDEKQHSAYFVASEQELIHEDTVKTYCTEGTPHGTSLNSSRAASASDLQEDSRMRNLARKSLEQNKLNSKQPANYVAVESKKLNNFMEPAVKRDLGSMSQFSDAEKGSQPLRYFESNIKTPEFTETENAEENNHPSARSQLSSRITPPKTAVNTLPYNQCDSVPSNSANIKLDVQEEFQTENSVYEKPDKFNKNFSANGVTSYLSSTLKSSNDSGYQVSDGDEDDEDLLAACINIGMQNNRHRHSFIGNSFEKLPRTETNLARYQTSVALDQMECNNVVDSSINNRDARPVDSEETCNIDACEVDRTEALQDEYSRTKFDTILKSSEKDERPEGRAGFSLSTVTQGRTAVEADEVPKTNLKSTMHTIEHGLTKENDESYNISLPSNMKDSPIGVLPKAHTDEQTYTSCIARHSDSQVSVQHNSVLVDEKRTLFKLDTNTWQSEKTSESVGAKLPETLNMQQSYAKATESESSESIDSVEQSEHALLELCIQPRITKTIDSVPTKQITRKPQDLNEAVPKPRDYSDASNSASEGVCEPDGIATKDLSEQTYKPTQNSACEVVRHADEEVYRRQRDPDAMIASLDRLTAALVQETEAMRERESSAMKQSILSDTWNEDSPNDVSFPSISISAPLIASFKSDVPEDQGTVTSEYVETASSESGHMTNSKIIQREAIKLAEAVDAEMNKQHELETTSLTSMDLDAIKPPSSMGSLLSLTASYAGMGDSSEIFINRDRCYSTSLPPVQVKSVSSTDSRNCRKKSLPLGVVAKRALSQGQSHAGSLENLLNECTGSHLENVKPPSMMDELPDVGDMENSMVSVASITSEVADSKEHDSQSLTGSDPVFDLLKPVANVLSMTCLRYAEAMQSSANNSLSECLENINPPSLFNEVCEMDESTMEPATETVCSDTLCIDAELNTEEAPHLAFVDKIDEGENDTDEGATPISSEYCVSSSAESTPKKRLHKNLTPKQKRNLAKERYKTYTIAAEFVKKEEERRKQEGITDDEHRIPRGKCSPFSKLTPKQRRQEDRARFQTQVLENPFPDLNASPKQGIDNACQQEIPEKLEATSPVKSAIPTLTKLPVCKALRKKRTEHKENRERYRTRTLNDSESILRDSEPSAVSNAHLMEEARLDTAQNIKPDEIQTMLEQNATIVLNTLNESNKTNDTIGEDMLLDCETISLVSNECESERNLRMKFVNGLSKKLMDTCTPEAEDAQNITEDLVGVDEASDLAAARPQAELEYCDPVESESEDGSNNAEEQQQETKRPRIIKPGMVRDLSTDSNVTDKSEPESPKAIRGRRKALYSNPITRKPTPQSSPLKQANPVSGIPIGRSNTSPIVRATRATTLRQSNNSPNSAAKDSAKTNTSPKIAAAAGDTEKRMRNPSNALKRASVPQKGSSLTFTKSVKRHSTPPTYSSNFQNDAKPETNIKPLERQGTFTKDEPEVENAPTVVSSGSPIKTRIAKPIRGASAKVHPTAGKSKISVKTHQTKITKASSSEKIQPAKGLPLLVAPKRLPTGKLAGTPRAPAGNQNLAQHENSKVFRKVGPLGQRSNSNSSIVSNTSASMQTRKLAKEATSKIASLWKKVEESKNKQRLEKPDTRQWVQPTAEVSEVDAQGALNKPPAFRLFRSSTFEGVPQEVCHHGLPFSKTKTNRPQAAGAQGNGTKYRNCDLCGTNANEAPCKIPVKAYDSSTYKKENGQIVDGSVILRKQQSADTSGLDTDPTKRISRLGSFIRVDGSTAECSTQVYVNGNGVRAPASAVVPPFNYNPRQDVSSQATKVTSDESENKGGVMDCHTEIVTGSARVTTV